MGDANSLNVVDEFSDLLHLYHLTPFTKETLRESLETHFTKYGRVGFNTKLTENVIEMFYRRFTLTFPKKLEKEEEFIIKIANTDFSDMLKASWERAKKFLPEQHYEYPKAVFLLNGGRTDAKLLGETSFGINLQNLFDKVYSPDTNEYRFQKALEIIEDSLTHEGNHIFIRQVRFSSKGEVPMLIDVAFYEGIAMLTGNNFYFPWSEDYRNNYTIWLNIVSKALDAKTKEDKEAVLDILGKNPILGKYNEQTAPLVEEAKKDIEGTFETTLYKLLVERNGPLYYMGYMVWKKILDTEGATRVTEVIKMGPKEYSKYILNSLD